jgi:hypothetical protein
MIFLYLFFAHLLGDFVFQSYELIKYKTKSFYGLFLHSFIHFSLSFIVLSIIFKKITIDIALVVLFIAITHFFIDYLKIHFEKRSAKRFYPFIIDQLLHLIVLLIASIYLLQVLYCPKGIFSELVIWLSLVILSTQFIDLLMYQKSREENPKKVYKENLKSFRKRTLIVSVFFLIILIVKNLI